MVIATRDFREGLFVLRDTFLGAGSERFGENGYLHPLSIPLTEILQNGAIRDESVSSE